MGISTLTVAAYLMVGGCCGAWFWRIIRSTGHRVNAALIVVSVVFGVLWPVMLPGVTVYRWMLPRPSVFREDAATITSR
ncbi:hypothetical protein L2K20_08600 [Mycobacterium sp. MBM]|nr:hypothetical protein [Mycobacterium sp. MBM]